jgi:hypothetical protein
LRETRETWVYLLPDGEWMLIIDLLLAVDSSGGQPRAEATRRLMSTGKHNQERERVRMDRNVTGDKQLE